MRDQNHRKGVLPVILSNKFSSEQLVDCFSALKKKPQRFIWSIFIQNWNVSIEKHLDSKPF